MEVSSGANLFPFCCELVPV